MIEDAGRYQCDQLAGQPVSPMLALHPDASRA